VQIFFFFALACALVLGHDIVSGDRHLLSIKPKIVKVLEARTIDQRNPTMAPIPNKCLQPKPRRTSENPVTETLFKSAPSIY